MKKALFNSLALVAMAGVLTTAPLAAQQSSWDDSERRHGPPSAEQKLLRLSESLDLSDAQSLQLLEVLHAARADHEALQTRMMDSFGAELCALRASVEADILDILTPDQALSFQLMKQQRDGRREGKRNRGQLECPVE